MKTRQEAIASMRQVMPKLYDFFKKYFDDDNALEGGEMGGSPLPGWFLIKPIVVNGMIVNVSISIRELPPTEEENVEVVV